MKLIANISSNSGLGMNDGSLLFHIKEDMKHFKEITVGSEGEGNLVIMGRKTFESIIEISGKPLPNRLTIILTSDPNYTYSHSNVQVYNDIDLLIKHYKTFGEGDKKVFVVGGASLYSQLLPFCKEILLTIVNRHVEDCEIFYPLSLQESLGFQTAEESEEFYTDKYDCYYKFVRYTKPTESSL